MATTVTFVGDQVPTVATWGDLNETLNVGDPQEINTGVAETIDTDRLQFASVLTGGGSTSGTGQYLVCQIDIEAGCFYYIEGLFTLKKDFSEAVDDDPQVGIKFSNDVFFAHQVDSLGTDWESSPRLYDRARITEGSGDVFLQQGQNSDNVNVNSPFLRVYGILVAQESGTMEYYYNKVTDVASTRYQASDYTYLSAERLRI